MKKINHRPACLRRTRYQSLVRGNAERDITHWKNRNCGASRRVYLEAVLATVGNSQGGFFLEVDLEYHERLHEQQQNFLLDPAKRFGLPEWKRNYQTKSQHIHVQRYQ